MLIPPIDQINTVTQKYLKQHSLAINLDKWPHGTSWDWVLIIPVCGEVKSFLTYLMQHQHHQNVLVIVAVNRPKGHTNSDRWQLENEELIRHLSSQFKQQCDLFEGHRLLTANTTENLTYGLLLLNFNAQPFDPNKGVGLARRIAADTALSLIDCEVIKSPWIFSTDADVVLPAEYFNVVEFSPEKTSALSLKFTHISNDSNQQELQSQYDFKLRYYQSGVRFIGAAYDYIPLGSTLVAAAESYAQVRGFPCRSGGEDFYILNKLAKMGSIFQPLKPVIEIQSRFSDRVPFGTGPAISQLQQLKIDGVDSLYYHPEIFHVLKAWYLDVSDYYVHQKFKSDDHGLNQYWQIEKILQQATNQINSKQRWHQFVHEWFDAFKILKSVHFLRQQFKSLPQQKLIQSCAYQELIG